MYQRRLAYSSKKRKYPYTKKSYGRTNKYRKANNASSYFTYDAPRAKSITRLNAAIGSELKQYYHETDIPAANISAANWINGNKFNDPFPTNKEGGIPTVAVLPRIKNGSTYDTRIGDKIAIKSIDFRLRVTYNHEHYEGQVDDLAVWIVLDKSPNGVGAKWVDIFHGQTCTTLSQKHMKNENRFQILKTFQMPAIGDGPGGSLVPQYTPRFMYYKFKKPMIVRYQSSAADGVYTQADVVENNIYIIATSNGASTKVAHTTEGPWKLHMCIS